MQLSRQVDSRAFQLQSYDDAEIVINNTPHRRSLILMNDELITIDCSHVTDLKPEHLQPLIAKQTQILILASAEPCPQPPLALVEFISQQHMGFEAMNIGAACRTYTLLQDERRIALVFILAP